MFTTEFIKKVIEEYFNLAPGSIDSRSRLREIKEARQIAQYFARQLIENITLKTIGKEIGGVKHDTVIHSLIYVNELLGPDPKFKFDVDEIEKELRDPKHKSELIKKQIEKLTIELFGENSNQLKLIDQILCCD
jgi:hypothetical protein